MPPALGQGNVTLSCPLEGIVIEVEGLLDHGPGSAEVEDLEHFRDVHLDVLPLAHLC